MNRIIAFSLASFLGFPLSLLAQGATLAPHIVVIDDRTRSSTITMYNPGAQPLEVSVGMTFGIAVTDSAGAFAVRYGADSSAQSAAPWLMTYPRRFTLAPMARQTVRILARPPAGLIDGEYWARMTVATRDGAVAMGTADTTGIHVGLGLEVRTILPVYYRKGAMSTGVTLSAPSVSRDGDSLAIRLPMVRTGVAAYVGKVKVDLVNALGVAVGHADYAVAVFQDALPRLAISIRGLPSGDYRLRVEALTERAGVQPGTLVTSPATRAEFAVVL